ncbi:unnamed protein product [Effrenium voratum]|uniref:Nucleotide-diphospho-sugar transferase domain-containing protein n=1 Tax=Effrenium voratum TaxID=2562239 RepID=A0AA36IU43_9DINO|nr:unnamed protein product [Effrenium voratum]
MGRSNFNWTAAQQLRKVIAEQHEDGQVPSAGARREPPILVREHGRSAEPFGRFRREVPARMLLPLSREFFTKIAGPEKLIIVSWTTGAPDPSEKGSRTNIALNLALSIRKHASRLERHFAYISMDAVAHQVMQEHGFNSALCDVTCRTADLKDDIWKMRWYLMLTLTSFGLRALVVDADIVFLGDPLKEFYGDSDMEVMTDHFFPEKHLWEPWVRVEDHINTGFVLVKPSQPLRFLIADFLDLNWESEQGGVRRDGMDQRVFNHFIVRQMSADIPLVVGRYQDLSFGRAQSIVPAWPWRQVNIRILDPARIAHGMNFFWRRAHLLTKVALPPVAHVNGADPKEYFLRDRQVWFLDDWHDRFNESTRFLTYAHLPGTLKEDFSQLAAAVEVAKLLNRRLVLPSTMNCRNAPSYRVWNLDLTVQMESDSGNCTLDYFSWAKNFLDAHAGFVVESSVQRAEEFRHLQSELLELEALSADLRKDVPVLRLKDVLQVAVGSFNAESREPGAMMTLPERVGRVRYRLSKSSVSACAQLGYSLRKPGTDEMGAEFSLPRSQAAHHQSRLMRRRKRRKRFSGAKPLRSFAEMDMTPEECKNERCNEPGASEVNMKSVDLGRLEKALTELDDFSRRLALLEAFNACSRPDLDPAATGQHEELANTMKCLAKRLDDLERTPQAETCQIGQPGSISTMSQRMDDLEKQIQAAPNEAGRQAEFSNLLTRVADLEKKADAAIGQNGQQDTPFDMFQRMDDLEKQVKASLNAASKEAEFSRLMTRVADLEKKTGSDNDMFQRMDDLEKQVKAAPNESVRQADFSNLMTRVANMEQKTRAENGHAGQQDMFQRMDDLEKQIQAAPKESARQEDFANLMTRVANMEKKTQAENGQEGQQSSPDMSQRMDDLEKQIQMARKGHDDLSNIVKRFEDGATNSQGADQSQGLAELSKRFDSLEQELSRRRLEFSRLEEMEHKLAAQDAGAKENLSNMIDCLDDLGSKLDASQEGNIQTAQRLAELEKSLGKTNPTLPARALESPAEKPRPNGRSPRSRLATSLNAPSSPAKAMVRTKSS